MQRYLLGRIGWSLLAIWGVLSLVFVILRLSGDPAAMLLPTQATQEDYERLRHLLGLDQALPVQYGIYLGRIVHGDFGKSFQYGIPAFGVAVERLPATLRLAGAAAILIIICAPILGMVSAVYRDSWADYMSNTLALIGQAAPNFWLGIMLILFFAVSLRWLPTSGAGTVRHLVLPSVTLALQPVAKIMRLTRSEMLDVLGEDFIRTAHAKGLPPWAVVIRHALKNASLAIITVIGLDIGYLMGGAIITETVFSWPGMGRLVVEAINNRDFPVIQSAVILIAFLVVTINLIVDALYAALDPRVRFG